jgi:integration host factor subunit alpha
MAKSVTKLHISRMLHNKIGLSNADSLSLLNEMLEDMCEILEKEGILKISSFGTFRVCKKKERIGRNPKTLEEFVITERNVISFRPSMIFKKAINSHG